MEGEAYAGLVIGQCFHSCRSTQCAYLITTVRLVPL